MHKYKCVGCGMNFQSHSVSRAKKRNNHCIPCHVSVLKKIDIEKSISEYVRKSDEVSCLRCNGTGDVNVPCFVCECTDVHIGKYC